MDLKLNTLLSSAAYTLDCVRFYIFKSKSIQMSQGFGFQQNTPNELSTLEPEFEFIPLMKIFPNRTTYCWATLSYTFK